MVQDDAGHDCAVQKITKRKNQKQQLVSRITLRMLITRCWLADCTYDADHTYDADDCLQVSRPVARLRRSRFISSAAYHDHTQLRFGRQVTIVIFVATIMMILRSINMAIMTNGHLLPVAGGGQSSSVRH